MECVRKIDAAEKGDASELKPIDSRAVFGDAMVGFHEDATARPDARHFSDGWRASESGSLPLCRSFVRSTIVN